MPERCEWNPRLSKPALNPPRPDDCPNEARVSLGTGAENIHLCETCAVLPKFARFRRRVPLPRGAA